MLFTLSYTQSFKSPTASWRRLKRFTLISSWSTNTDLRVHNDQFYFCWVKQLCLQPNLDFIAPILKNSYNLLKGGPFLCHVIHAFDEYWLVLNDTPFPSKRHRNWTGFLKGWKFTGVKTGGLSSYPSRKRQNTMPLPCLIHWKLQSPNSDANNKAYSLLTDHLLIVIPTKTH